MHSDWLLLIYTLPSQPSRKRAYVWRELKRLGAVYLRDGVAVLPRGGEVEERIDHMRSRVEEYGGTADVISSPQFSGERSVQLVRKFQDERMAEYRELYHACVRFLRDVLSEVDADDFGFPDVDNLESELHRLRRWSDQIGARDYFNCPGSARVAEILNKCERAFEQFVFSAHSRSNESSDDDCRTVQERSRPAGTDTLSVDELPL